MDGYFEKEFMALEKELTYLKTSAQRSSGTITTISKTIQVNVNLVNYDTFCRGEAYYIIKPEADSIVNITLDWYFQDVAKEWEVPRVSRSIRFRKIALPDNTIGVQIYAAGTTWSLDDNDDLSRLKRGESVIISANMTVQCTNNFTIEAQ